MIIYVFFVSFFHSLFLSFIFLQMGPKVHKVDEVSHEQRAHDMEEELLSLKAVAAKAAFLKTTISSKSATVSSLKGDLQLAEALLSTAIADLASLNDQNQAAKKLAVVEYQTAVEEVYTYIHHICISICIYIDILSLFLCLSYIFKYILIYILLFMFIYIFIVSKEKASRG